MTYRATPVTQRDGSPLASSNCRMASIATGLDYDTLGKKKSTGGKMRTYTSDQSGGTDSGDAREAWDRGYNEVLRVMDGHTWADAVADLRAGRLVHLDVWAAAVGKAGMCLSGTGQYGHTIAVAPESSGTRWLVADPWCNPAKWQWCEAAALQKGAETWSGQVTAGRRRRPGATIAEVIRELFLLWNPEHPRDDPPDPPETAGGSIYYTTTAAQGGSSGGGADVSKFVQANGYGSTSGMLINISAGSPWYYFDGTKGGLLGGTGVLNLVCFGLLDSTGDNFVVRIRTGVPYADKEPRDTHVLIKTTNDPYPAPSPLPPQPDAYNEGWNDARAAIHAQVDLVVPEKG